MGGDVKAQVSRAIVVIDEAQHLSDAFLIDLGGFLNFAFDSRELFTLWLVGLPTLSRRLHLLQHSALLTRVASEVRLEPLDRDTFLGALEHAITVAGATNKLYSAPVRDGAKQTERIRAGIFIGHGQFSVRSRAVVIRGGRARVRRLQTFYSAAPLRGEMSFSAAH